MEESDSDQTETSCSEESDSSQGSFNKKPIKVIGQILKKLVNDDVDVVIEKPSKKSKDKKRDFFCIEDSFLTKDLKLFVEGIGQIVFPLEKESIEQMIKLSSKAKFGKGRETILDTNVRDTQTIPASKLKIDIHSSALNDLLKRICSGLKLGKNCQLIPHLHNLLIYGPGQFFKKHTDSEKVENMVATLVIVLPYPHNGGELIIEHNQKKHMFFGSKNPDVAKCIAFYADCAHEIKKVTEGYRVAITYNVVLQPPDIPDVVEISDPLDRAVDGFFKSGERKLVFGLNHSYSQKNLRWNLLKGVDRPRVNALLAVAKKQGRIPCLALTTYHETYDKENTHYNPWESPVLVHDDAEIKFMIDENNVEFKFSSKDTTIFNNHEYCCTKKTKDLFQPFESKDFGPTGNEGHREESWYRRACLVLWSGKWAYTEGYMDGLSELHQLTKQEGMQNILLEKIAKLRSDFSQPEMWTLPRTAEMILDIAIYLKDDEISKYILGNLSEYILNEDHINQLIKLEQIFSSHTWSDTIKIWKEKDSTNQCFIFFSASACSSYSGWRKLVNNAPQFIDKYIQLKGDVFNSIIVDTILEEKVKDLIHSESFCTSKYVYHRKREESIGNLALLMKICSVLRKTSLEKSLIDHVIGSSYPAVSIGELYTKLMDYLDHVQLVPYEPIKALAVKDINQLLSDLERETDWYLPVKITCNCKTCSPVWKFLHSTKASSQVFEGPKKMHDHLFEIFYSGLGMYSLPCKWSHTKEGRKHKIALEKLPKLLEDRQKLNCDLMKFKEKIDPVLFVNIKVENTDEVDENPKDFSSIEITEDFKDDPEDWLDNSVGGFSSTEQAFVKSECTEHHENSKEEEEVPAKKLKTNN